MRPSSVAKRRAITENAVDVFVRHGFDEASMDEIALLSGVSKQTVYTHFGSKEALFVAVVTEATAAGFRRAHRPPAEPSDVVELGAALREYGIRLLDVVLDPRLLGLRRLAIAELHRFPGLAEAFRLGGPVAAIREMAERLSSLDTRGLLRVPDPIVAATTLNWLLVAGPLNDAMLGAPRLPAGEPRAIAATEAVRVFLAGYRAN